MHIGISWAAAMLAGLLGVAVPAAPAVSAGGRGIVELGAGWANDVNGSGEIVGYSSTGATPVQGSYAIWTGRDRTQVTLGLPWTGHTDRADITERGDVAVRGYVRRAGALTALVHPTGDRVVTTAINEYGVVAGYRTDPDSATAQALIWNDGLFTDFPGWPGMTFSQAVDINNRGQVLVSLVDEQTAARYAVVWWRGRVTGLGTLGGSFTNATVINDSGMVIGTSTDANGTTWPFLWANGVMTKLAGAAENGFNDVEQLSERGDVVGHAGFTPVLWRNGVPIELVPGRTGVATAVNERGDVAGTLVEEVNGVVVRTPFRWRQGRVVTYALPEEAATVDVVGVDLYGRVTGTVWFEHPTLHSMIWTTS